MRTAASRAASAKRTATPELELDELLLDELLLELIPDELLLDELLLDELLLSVRPEELLLLVDEEFDELELAELEVEELELEELELDELLAVWPVSPVSLELQAASSREHINADKILGTAYLQAVLAMGLRPQSACCYCGYATPL